MTHININPFVCDNLAAKHMVAKGFIATGVSSNIFFKRILNDIYIFYISIRYVNFSA